jgi:hypothetical protein
VPKKTKLFCIIGLLLASCENSPLPTNPAPPCNAQRADNLLPNAGFDRGPTPWSTDDQGPLVPAVWDPVVDAAECASSGSLKVDDGKPVVSPFLPVARGVIHHFGFVAQRRPPLPSTNPCTIRWCKSKTCQLPDDVIGTDEAYARPASPGEKWERSSGDFLPPPAAIGARVVCGLGPGTHHYDQFYWSTVGAAF